MDRKEGFPPHVIGFMKRKREKEKPDEHDPTNGRPFGVEAGRVDPNA